MRALAEQGPDVFYQRSIADAIVAEMERSRTAAVPDGERGVMTAEDLASYQPIWRAPSLGRYHGRDILAVPPPTAGSVVVLEVLNLLEGFPLGRDRAFGHSSANYLHVLAEAKKIAVADRNAYVADPAYVDVPTGRIIAKDYADRRRADIDPAKANDQSPGRFDGVPLGPPAASGRERAPTMSRWWTRPATR